jgi:hypothetical protein
MKISLALGPRQPLSRQTAWGCVTTNLAGTATPQLSTNAYLVVVLPPADQLVAPGTSLMLRAVAGAVAIRVEFSEWLLICTILLALFLTFCKRRHELSSMGGLCPQFT